MRTLSTWIASIALSALGFTAIARAEDGAPKPAEKRCVVVTTEAIFSGYAYNHVVHLANTCDKTMRCEVRTKATPEPIVVLLEKDEKRTITTFRGSPASEVEAEVKCEEVKR